MSIFLRHVLYNIHYKLGSTPNHKITIDMNYSYCTLTIFFLQNIRTKMLLILQVIVKKYIYFIMNLI
ncbi:hypothetical protein A8B98_12210 [Hymenobacter sp. UV11]|nr:hypothetical protein A8B98_12210 [Hymenobacter sp. UV11]